jgi:hypothetical protein
MYKFVTFLTTWCTHTDEEPCFEKAPHFKPSHADCFSVVLPSSQLSSMPLYRATLFLCTLPWEDDAPWETRNRAVCHASARPHHQPPPPSVTSSLTLRLLLTELNSSCKAFVTVALPRCPGLAMLCPWSVSINSWKFMHMLYLFW